MQDERDARLGQARPHGIKLIVAGRTTARCAVGDPGGAHAGADEKFDFLNRLLRIVCGQQSHGPEAFIIGAELGHGPVVRPRRGGRECPVRLMKRLTR